eukprot:GHVR01107755.1.p1 GENE.GHVR01107755.1~~GHVR01107755.1.p1  ORF type:complete len:307 (+),score=97.72 GHVR01107755.1:813-1733(+)
MNMCNCRIVVDSIPNKYNKVEDKEISKLLTRNITSQIYRVDKNNNNKKVKNGLIKFCKEHKELLRKFGANTMFIGHERGTTLCDNRLIFGDKGLSRYVNTNNTRKSHPAYISKIKFEKNIDGKYYAVRFDHKYTLINHDVSIDTTLSMTKTVRNGGQNHGHEGENYYDDDDDDEQDDVEQDDVDNVQQADDNAADEENKTNKKQTDEEQSNEDTEKSNVDKKQSNEDKKQTNEDEEKSNDTEESTEERAKETSDDEVGDSKVETTQTTTEDDKDKDGEEDKNTQENDTESQKKKKKKSKDKKNKKK